jgi:GDP/UDP-N,N'-diacetylbacillosamine 2-epimerase (hydrolysing)
MNKGKKILVITGSRAEYGLLYPLLLELLKSGVFELELLVTGSHTQKKYGNTIELIRKDDIPIAHIVEINEEASMIEALAQEILGIEKYCKGEMPDLMLVWGDRDEAFAGAIVAGHLRIPLAHVGGGDVSGYVVDEAIRHAISKFAHVHFPISAQSAEILRKLGEEESRIHMVGTTAFDLITKETLMSREELAKELSLDAREPWTLLLEHPTPLDPTPIKEQITPALEVLEETPGQKIILYPNSDTGNEIFVKEIESYKNKKGFSIFESLPRLTFLSLLNEAQVLVGNSSSGVVEAGFFKKPVVDIGNRQKGRECGENVLHAEYDKGSIQQAMARATSSEFANSMEHMKNPYGSGNAAKQIIQVLENLRIDQELLYKKIP